SGTDLTLEYVGLRYAFSRRDFAERAASAARTLDLVGQADLEPAESDDLVRLVARGRVSRPRSALGRHLAELATGPGGPALVYWLRKLVFRSAWLDQRVKHGLIEPVYDERSGTFAYDAGPHELPALVDDVPSWAAARFGG